MPHDLPNTSELAASPVPLKHLRVAAGLLLRPDGSLLLGQRPEGKSYAGWWELPGGKLEPGEEPVQALCRELNEELGITVTRAYPWVSYVHVYPQSVVRLWFYRVVAWEGDPTGIEGQRLSWVDPQASVAEIEAGLGSGHLLPATLPPIAWLKVPPVYVIVAPDSPVEAAAILRHVAQAIDNGGRLFQFRAPDWHAGPAASSLYDLFCQVLRLVHEAGGRLLVNSAHPESWWAQADGVHLRSTDLERKLPKLAEHAWVAASAHSEQELERARNAGALFAVLGPVLPTATHPDAQPLGWERFAQLAQTAGIPVFALGGQSENTLETAWRHGAHGIAGIRQVAAACRLL